ncbi:hydrolase [Corynebacterium pseudotuberculosis]|uniref:HAD family hydrolase n=1 Tax=Corynebacterium pseudotuberculosis TaxID=1719 RepID=UPI000737BA33|nr:HAD family phosphatase [Corynebacterium pseudotuberculosis]ALU21496.1 hydrolase [Corynebacterium pseudotuberculosis]ANH23757.1 Haloacid dehalogenase-like hydrolase [Corynebacterium pseudotuberculosis]
MLEAILWDMDGTLVDSEGIWAEATFAISEEMGNRLTADQQLQTVGASFDFTLGLCADNAGLALDSNSREFWKNRLFSQVSALFATELTLKPGLSGLLDSVHQAGIPMAIATNTVRRVAQHSIHAIGESYFDATICGDEVANPKPAPDIYCEAAQRLKTQPRHCIAFEDSYNGMLSALAAGCIVIGVPEQDDMRIPKGVTLMNDLHGSTDFSGVTLNTVEGWFNKIST